MGRGVFPGRLVGMAGSDPAAASRLREKLQPFVTENRAMLRGDAMLGASVVRYRHAYQDFQAKLQAVVMLGDCASNLGLHAAALGALPSLQARLQGWD